MGGVNKQFFSGRIEGVCVFDKYLRSSVIPPRPMLVKKLMANLVSLGLSLGINPSHASARVASRDLQINSE